MLQCSTSCDFVKKGAAETASLNRGALIAAEDLAQSQRMLQRVVEQLRVDPDNVELQAQRENLQIEVADKTHTLQLAGARSCGSPARASRRCTSRTPPVLRVLALARALAVGANVPDNSVAMEAANIQAKQKQLDELNRKLQASPADPDLQRQRDALQESIHAKDEALKAAGARATPRRLRARARASSRRVRPPPQPTRSRSRPRCSTRWRACASASSSCRTRCSVRPTMRSSRRRWPR